MAKPQIVFTPEAWDWMRGYTLALNEEIGGFGYVYSPEKGLFIVDAIFLAPQEVSGGGVHFKEGAMGFMVEKAVEDDRLNDARFSWHSHNTMNCYWSATDEEGIKDYQRTGMPWLVSAVTNHKGEVKARLDIFESVVDHITIQDTEVRVGMPDPGMNTAIEEDIAAMVERRPTQMYSTGTRTGSTSNSGGSTGGNKGGKHRQAGERTQPALPAGKQHRTSADWWDEIDWSNITDEELTQVMKEHGFDVDAEVVDDESSKTDEQMAKIEAMH